MADTHIRTRYAPSPTGTPHIGNTRTALYDYLIAKKYGGDFLLRIEDTDQDRFVVGSTENIYRGLDLLGLKRDEDPLLGGPYGPYVQSERLALYQQHAQLLIDMGAAYYCFCSEERLVDLHKTNPFAKYDRHCRNLTAAEVDSQLKSGAPYVIRAKLPETGFTVWHDLVQGKLSLPNTECDDKVLMKTNGVPTYHLAVVVDDYFMKITHVLRGVEWMMSTPIHLFLYESFGWQPPTLVHVPLLLGPDKSKLSKRHGAKSAIDYITDGYLPEAINNFMFYMGFSYQDNSALLTLDQMADVFDEKRLQRQNAIFDIQRLNHLNNQWIKRLDNEGLFNRLKSFIPEDWQSHSAKVLQILALVKDRLVTLSEFAPAADYFFNTPTVKIEDLLIHSEHSLDVTQAWFDVVKKVIQDESDFTATNLHDKLGQAQSVSVLTPKQAFMSLRFAISGRSVTPQLFDCLVILGKEETLRRLDLAFN